MWKYLSGESPSVASHVESAEDMLIAAQKRKETVENGSETVEKKEKKKDDSIGGGLGLLEPSVKRRLESAISAGQLQLKDFDGQKLSEVSKLSAEKQKQVLDRFLAMCEPDAETSDKNGEKDALFESAVRSVMTQEADLPESSGKKEVSVTPPPPPVRIKQRPAPVGEVDPQKAPPPPPPPVESKPSDIQSRNQRIRQRRIEEEAALRKQEKDSGKDSTNGANKESQSREPEPDSSSDPDNEGLWKDYGIQKSSGKDYGSQVTMRVMKSPTGYREVTLDMQNWKLGDDGLRETLTPTLRRRLEDKLADLRPEDPWHYINVDLSGNKLGPEGALILLNFLRSTHKSGIPCYVRILKLYKNKLGDEGMKHIAAIILTQPQPIHEIHLSHNDITAVGAITLVLSLGHIHPQEAYPLYIPPKYERWAPCWCRLERNSVEEPETILKALQRSGDVRVIETSRTTKDWGPLRSPSSCRTVDDVPHAILHIFSDQARDSSMSKVTPKIADDIICRASEVLFDFLSEDAQNKTEQKARSKSENSLPLSKPVDLVKRVDVEEAKHSVSNKIADKKNADTNKMPKPGTEIDQEGIAFLQSLSAGNSRQVSAPVTCKELEAAHWQDYRGMPPPPPPPMESLPKALQREKGQKGRKLDPQTLFAVAAGSQGMPDESRSRTQSIKNELKSRLERHSPIPSDEDTDFDWKSRSLRVARDQALHMISHWKEKVTPDFFSKQERIIEMAKSPLEAAARINATAERLEAQGFLRAPDEGSENMLRMAALLYHKRYVKMQHLWFGRSPGFGFTAPAGVMPALQLPAAPPGSFVMAPEPTSSSKGFAKGKGKFKGDERGKGKGKFRRDDFRDRTSSDDMQTVLLDDLLKGQGAKDGKDRYVI